VNSYRLNNDNKVDVNTLSNDNKEAIKDGHHNLSHSIFGIQGVNTLVLEQIVEYINKEFPNIQRLQGLKQGQMNLIKKDYLEILKKENSLKYSVRKVS
jgi:hypothetical protein